MTDDFSMLGHNGTTRAVRKLDHAIGGIDEIVALWRLLGRGLTDGYLAFEDVEGRAWSCSVRPAWRACGAKAV
eukprot:4983852-Amphidinium_carterae.1